MIQARADVDQTTVSLVSVGRAWSYRTVAERIGLAAPAPLRIWTRIVRLTTVAPLGRVHGVAAAIGCHGPNAPVPLAIRISVAAEEPSFQTRRTDTERVFVGDGTMLTFVINGGPKTLPMAVQYSGRPVE